MLSLSTNGVLQPEETFRYASDTNTYYAVYQATNKGNVQLNITANSNCRPDAVCQAPVYTLTINVQ
jgi:hypothetical protein